MKTYYTKTDDLKPGESYISLYKNVGDRVLHCAVQLFDDDTDAIVVERVRALQAAIKVKEQAHDLP